MSNERLPTPDLLGGDCVHGRDEHEPSTGCDYRINAIDCCDCIDLALSRTRDEGIEAAARLAYEETHLRETVRQHMATANQSRSCGFDAADDISVLVTPRDAEQNAAALQIAVDLQAASFAIATLRNDITAREQEREGMAEQIRDLKRQVKALTTPPKPSRLFGRGFVRFDNTRLWVLGNREKGFGAFGYWFEGWDEMFRALDVRVVEYGVDEHGPWWAVENRPEGK